MNQYRSRSKSMGSYSQHQRGNEHGDMTDSSFVARRIPIPTYIHLMPTRTSRFTRIRHRTIFVNRLTFFSTSLSSNIINAIGDIHFVGPPTVDFPKGTTIMEVINHFIKRSDLTPKDSPQVLSFYEFVVKESVSNAGKSVLDFKDIREVCHNMNFGVDIAKGLKYYTLVTVTSTAHPV